jgi:hypothetical protein
VPDLWDSPLKENMTVVNCQIEENLPNLTVVIYDCSAAHTDPHEVLRVMDGDIYLQNSHEPHSVMT